MLPTDATQNVFDRMTANTVFTAQLRHVGDLGLKDFAHVSISQFCIWASLAVYVAVLLNRVHSVVVVGSQKQVNWIYTSGIVALMAYVLVARILTSGKRERESMRFNQNAGLNREGAIPSFVQCSAPVQASAFVGECRDVRAKPLNRICSLLTQVKAFFGTALPSASLIQRHDKGFQANRACSHSPLLLVRILSIAAAAYRIAIVKVYRQNSFLISAIAPAQPRVSNAVADFFSASKRNNGKPAEPLAHQVFESRICGGSIGLRHDTLLKSGLCLGPLQCFNTGAARFDCTTVSAVMPAILKRLAELFS